jgi:hypothetical protein
VTLWSSATATEQDAPVGRTMNNLVFDQAHGIVLLFGGAYGVPEETVITFEGQRRTSYSVEMLGDLWTFLPNRAPS